MNNILITKSFKNSIIKVILAIALFLISYLALIALSVGLLIFCGKLGTLIISARPSFITLAAGAGLFALGIMFFLFLIKFIFSQHTDENPYRIEIFNEEHPELFAMIKDVSDSVGAQFPKKIFLTHNVNACVFYNSSFWSLFFPVKKNLEIGLGLVNSVNQAELKAVLAHEFGHFSQRSMKLGSYVYTVNHVIYNLVYEYDRWDRTLERWANAGGIFGLFALVTFKLVELVRFVLRKSYTLINIPYLSLSREMEFHADHIAAEVAGKENMVSALRRIEFCDIAFNNTITNLSTLAGHHKLSKNLFLNHNYDIQKQSEFFSLEMKGGLPLISDQDLELNKAKPRVIFKDQWASHPSSEEREKRILNGSEVILNSTPIDSWSVFNNTHSIQEMVTKNLYEVDYGDLNEFNFIDNAEYITYKESEQSKYMIDNFFNGFYDRRFILNVELNKNSDFPIGENIKDILIELYSKKTKLKFDKVLFDNNDLLTLNQIQSKEINTKYFEFDNKKYHRRKVNQVINSIEKEINSLKNELAGIEEKAILINISLAEKISHENKILLLEKYTNLFNCQNIVEEHQKFFDTICGYQYTIYNKPTWKEEDLNQFTQELFEFEQKYKNYIIELNIENYTDILDKQKSFLSDFINGAKTFIDTASFDIDLFNEFVSLLFGNHDLVNNSLGKNLKELTDIQLENYKQLDLTEINLMLK